MFLRLQVLNMLWGETAGLKDTCLTLCQKMRSWPPTGKCQKGALPRWGASQKNETHVLTVLLFLSPPQKFGEWVLLAHYVQSYFASGTLVLGASAGYGKHNRPYIAQLASPSQNITVTIPMGTQQLMTHVGGSISHQKWAGGPLFRCSPLLELQKWLHMVLDSILYCHCATYY